MMRGRWVILAVAVIAWIGVLVAWIGGDPRLSAVAYEAFSSYNTAPNGVSRAYAYLAATHRDVRRLTREISIERPLADAAILRLAPFPEPQPLEEEGEDEDKPKPKSKSKKAEKPKPPKIVESLLDDQDEAWVRNGGRLIIAPSENFGELHVDDAKCGGYRRVFPAVPPLPDPDVSDCRALSGAALLHFHSLVINDRGPVIARQPVGAGDVILVSVPNAFSNESLARGANLALLESLLANRRTIYFDEAIHGIEEGSGVFDLLIDEWSLGPSLLILALAAIATFWRKARATGPPDRIDRDIRSDAVDLVQSLGQLYDRSVDRDESLRLYYQAFVRAAHARTGLTGESLDRLVRARTEGYDPKPHFHDISREEFQRMLDILNHAYETVAYANTR